MANIPVTLPAIPRSPADAPNAVRFGDTIFTGAVLGTDGGPDVVAQAERAFAHLATVLGAAGADMEHVARINCYVDPGAGGALERIRAVRDRHLARGAQAGTEVPLTIGAPGALIALEAIAHAGAPKRLIEALPGAATRSGWADAVQVANSLYVSGQYGGGASFADEATSVYAAFDKIVTAAGVSWRDVVRVHQFAVRPDLSIDAIRVARSPFLRPEEFLSASVVCHPVPLAGIPPWHLVVDIEAALAPKTYTSTPGVWANPGGLHIVKSGDTAYFTAQMSRDAAGKTLFPDDEDAHADQVCRNLDGMMRTAGISWADVLHARVFCKHGVDVATVRRAVDRWVKVESCARTELVVGFFDPLATVEIELTASL